MVIGSSKDKNDKNDTNISIDLDGSFKSVNTTIQHSDFVDGEKKSILKKLKTVPGTGILLAACSSVCFATGSLCCRLLSDEGVNSNQVVVAR